MPSKNTPRVFATDQDFGTMLRVWPALGEATALRLFERDFERMTRAILLPPPSAERNLGRKWFASVVHVSEQLPDTLLKELKRRAQKVRLNQKYISE